MRPIFFSLALLAGMANAPALAADHPSKAERVAIAMSPTEVSTKVAVDDDPYKPAIILDTRAFIPPKYLDRNDHFLRAFIDRKTRKVEYQLYFVVEYNNDWQLFDHASYMSSSGPVSLKAENLSSDVLTCSQWGRCLHLEHVVVDIPENVLREAANDATAGSAGTWNIKLFGRLSEGLEISFLKTEIAGILLAVDQRTKNP